MQCPIGRCGISDVYSLPLIFAEQHNCPICLCDFPLKDMCRLNCGHLLCKECPIDQNGKLLPIKDPPARKCKHCGLRGHVLARSKQCLSSKLLESGDHVAVKSDTDPMWVYGTVIEWNKETTLYLIRTLDGKDMSSRFDDTEKVDADEYWKEVTKLNKEKYKHRVLMLIDFHEDHGNSVDSPYVGEILGYVYYPGIDGLWKYRCIYDVWGKIRNSSGYNSSPKMKAYYNARLLERLDENAYVFEVGTEFRETSVVALNKIAEEISLERPADVPLEEPADVPSERPKRKSAEPDYAYTKNRKVDSDVVDLC